MSRQTGVHGYDTRKEMSAYLTAILILTFALVQTTLLGRVSLFGLKPELLLILACFFLLYLPDGKALAAVFMLGLISDAYSLAPFGMTTLSLLLTGAILLRVRAEMTDTNLFAWFVVLVGATLFNGLLHLALLRLVLWENVPVLSHLSKLPLLALINASLGACLFPFLSRMGDASRGSPPAEREGEMMDVSMRKAL